MLTHGSLFSGIGGFDLAAEIMGWENLFNCEIDPFCQRVLNYHFPDARPYKDIRRTDFTIWRGLVDVLSGGFPCQPFSLAGKRQGTEDERHLWPEMLRAVREIAPRWVVGENVYGIVNWSGGLVFEQVCADLENEGYQVQPYIIPACGVDAPHKRERVWFLAHLMENARGSRFRGQAVLCEQSRGTATFGASDVRLSGNRQKLADVTKNPNCNGCDNKDRQTESPIGGQRDIIAGSGERIYIQTGAYSYTHSPGFQTQGTEQQTAGFTGNLPESRIDPWQGFPAQSPVCCGNDVFPGELDGITFPKWCENSIKGYGNAVVPRLVVELFKAIKLYENKKDLSGLSNRSR